MELNATTRYALLATVQLANTPPDALVDCRRLAERSGVPPHYLALLLQELVRQGVIVSKQGVGGGYRLAKPASETTLLEVIEALAGPVVVDLPLKKGLAPDSQRKLSGVVDDMGQRIRERLRQVALGALKPARKPAGAGASSRRKER